MALSVELAFVIFGGIIVLGYLGELLSKKFSIPTALLLLALGFALKLSGYVEAESLAGIQGIFGSLALVVLLFDGGMALNIKDVIQKSGRVLVNSFLITVLGMATAAAFFMMIGLDPLLGAIMGAIAGGIGSSTTLSIIKNLNLPGSIRTFLTLESSLTDIFSIIFALVLTQALVSGIFDVGILGKEVAARFSIGMFLGAAMGIISMVLPGMVRKGYNYMMTIAIVLIGYSVTEFLGGSGPIAVLVLGVIFGNDSSFRKFLRLKPQSEGYPLIKSLQSEISFFIRTFFFVFLGVVVTIGSPVNLLIAAGFMALLYVIRYLSLSIISIGDKELKRFKMLLTSINPRGLTTAVLATYPLVLVQTALLAAPDERLQGLLPQLEFMPEIAFYMIILSILSTTVLASFIMRKNGGCGKKGETPDKGDGEPDEKPETEDGKEEPGQENSEKEEGEPGEYGLEKGKKLEKEEH